MAHKKISRMSSESVDAPRKMMTYTFLGKSTFRMWGINEVKPIFKLAFRRAFARWSEEIPVDFAEVETASEADIKIGFYTGYRCASRWLGGFAHAHKKSGSICVNGNVYWAGNKKCVRNNKNDGYDLEAMAMHEIGLVLGLDQSENKYSVMFPINSAKPGLIKQRIVEEDVERLQDLYAPIL